MPFKTPFRVMIGGMAIALSTVNPLLPQELAGSTTPREAVAETVTPAKSRGLAYSRMGIGGVHLGASIEAVLRRLGQPQRDETKAAPGLGGTIRTLTYKGLTVGLWEGKVYAISTTSPQFFTLDGVKVGDNQQKVNQIYGPGSQSSSEGTTTRLSYNNDAQASSLIFEFNRDRVKRILCVTLLN
ncbi:MAG: hypothetical protein ACM37W_21855 [Actinomycetota bacterium]